MLASALPYAAATPLADAARDLIEAWRIVDAGEWPLRGPRISELAHLGPAWFYLLALPMALTGSVSATLLLVGLLAALKFPLAFACGRRLLGARFGLLFALALAVPGWSLLAGVLVTHTSLVEAAVLAVLYCALRLAAGDGRHWWIALGLAVGAALHAHPSTLVLAPLLLALLPRRRWSAREAGALLLGVLAAALWFAPMLWAEWQDGLLPLREGLARYAAGAESTALNEAGGWRLLAGLLVGAPYFLLVHMAGALDGVLMALAYAVVAVATLAGVRRVASEGPLRQVALFALTALALGTLGLLALRGTTRFYMVLMLAPALALLPALALEALARGGRRRVVAVAAGAALLLALLANARVLQRAEHGAMRFSALAAHDIRQWDAPAADAATFPAWHQDRLGAQVCAEDGVQVLHGALAVLFDSALALPVRLRCGAVERLGVGGGAAVAAATHRLGLTPALLHALGQRDADWSSALRLAPDAVVAAAQPLPVPAGDTHPARPLGLGDPRDHALQMRAPADAVLLIGQLFALYGGETLAVRADGTDMTPVLRNASVVAYRCDACAGDVQWELLLRTGFPERIDVVLWSP